MLETEVPSWPFTRPSAMAMPPEYAKLRADQPVCRVTLMNGAEAWLVTRFEDVSFVLSDPRFSPRQPAGPLGPQAAAAGSLFQDPPAHTRLRGLVSKAFTPRRVEALRPYVTSLLERLTDDLEAAGKGADLMSTLSFNVPVESIAELIGVPADHRPGFKEASIALITADAGDVEGLRAAGPVVYGMVGELVKDKRANPGDDLMSALIQARDGEDRLNEDELVTMGMTLLIAGFVATTNSVGLGTVLLAENGGRLRDLHDDPSLVDGAVEEILRFEPKVSGPARQAKEDVEVAGVLIKAGDLVMAPEQCANRDERVFDDSEVFDIRRKNNHHMAFGRGIHHCLGAATARVQLQETFSVLSRRLPGLRPAVPLEELTWQMNFFGDNRFSELPVTW
ncbi:MAG TPA: cytochrome P450 [Pseudonocardiaceae bacterium]|nr:cytochrome P450 [Pseudonocardiaceae bacterium]